MKRKLIFGSCICIMLTIFNFINMLNVDNSKLELLFDKVEAFAAGETLPPVDVNCSGKGWGRCYEPIGSAHYWWCKEVIIAINLSIICKMKKEFVFIMFQQNLKTNSSNYLFNNYH